MRIEILYLSIVLFFISCQNSVSNKLKVASYELQSETRNLYTYNLKGLKDTTLVDYFMFVKGQLGYSSQTIKISRYDLSNNLILEQEYEGDNGKLKLVGERHLLYNQKHKLIKDTQIDDGEIIMATVLEYNDFDSLSKTVFISIRPEKTLEEEVNRSKNKTRYDTTITVYHYNSLKHLIDHKIDSSKISIQNISLNKEERTEIVNNTVFNTIDSTWYKNNSRVKWVGYSKGIGEPRKIIMYFNVHGDVVRELTYKLIEKS